MIVTIAITSNTIIIEKVKIASNKAKILRKKMRKAARRTARISPPMTKNAVFILSERYAGSVVGIAAG